MKVHTYTVHITPADEGGFVVHVPALNDAATQGETYEEAVAMAQDLIQGYLEALVKAGEPIPHEELDETQTSLHLVVNLPLVA